MVAIICFGIAISIVFLVVAALNAKPAKPVKAKYQSKLRSVLPPNPYLNPSYEEMIAERKKLLATRSLNKVKNGFRSIVQPDPKPESKPTESNLGKVINYDQGHGVKREQINESKLEQARRLSILHELSRKEKQHKETPEKREISVFKLSQLIRMVNGREDVARRLIEGNLKLFPDRSSDWACDKAISDIERDRR